MNGNQVVGGLVGLLGNFLGAHTPGNPALLNDSWSCGPVTITTQSGGVLVGLPHNSQVTDS